MRILRVLFLPMLNSFIRILVKTYHRRGRCHNEAIRNNEKYILYQNEVLIFRIVEIIQYHNSGYVYIYKYGYIYVYVGIHPTESTKCTAQ